MASYFRLFATFLDDEKYVRSSVDPSIKGQKKAKIVSAGQKWAWAEKEYLHSDWTSDTHI